MTSTAMGLAAVAVLAVLAVLVVWRLAARRRRRPDMHVAPASARRNASGDGAEMAVLLPAAVAAGGSRADDGPGDGGSHDGGGGWGGGGASGDTGGGDGGGGDA